MKEKKDFFIGYHHFSVACDYFRNYELSATFQIMIIDFSEKNSRALQFFVFRIKIACFATAAFIKN